MRDQLADKLDQLQDVFGDVDYQFDDTNPNAIRYCWSDYDQSTSSVPQVLRLKGLDKKQISDVLKQHKIKHRWNFDDGTAHLTMFY